jgi:hypothetical protein
MIRDTNRRLTNLNRAAQTVTPQRSIFSGNPIDITPEAVSDAVKDPGLASQVSQTAIVASEPDDNAAIAKLAAYNDLPMLERSVITKLPPLAVWNAQITVDPILGRILASQLDYTLKQATIDLPHAGFIKAASPVADSGQVTLTLNDGDLADGAGYKGLPFFRFLITTSTDNAASGQNYTITVEGHTRDGQVISTPEYSFQRVSADSAVVGIFIPFQVIATRATPVLAVFGTDGAVPRDVSIKVKGVTNTETLTVTAPGYATKELKEISSMYNLPSGHIV